VNPFRWARVKYILDYLVTANGEVMLYDRGGYGARSALGAGTLILVVEDDDANLLLTQTVLEQAGHRVLAAGTAEQAREMLSVEHADLVLTDIELPGASGLDLARELTEDPRTRDVPVVALTAHAMPEMRQKVLDAGCRDYLVKPIDIIELIRRVEANLERS
jgi:CheY-like chemotaxis protein